MKGHARPHVTHHTTNRAAGMELLGLLREEAGLASQVLLKSGVTLAKARELVRQVLTAGQTTSAPESEQHGES